MHNPRGRYPPGMGAGRGGGMNPNPMNPSPGFQSRPLQQQYVQRNFVQNQRQYLNQQQQQQWLRRGQSGSAADSSVDEVEKTVQSEAVDMRCAFS